MTSKLIQNQSNVFYTVQIKESLFVKDADFYGGQVDIVNVIDKESKAYKFNNKDSATKVALYVDGAIIKHTQTTVITEVAEKITVVEEVK